MSTKMLVSLDLNKNELQNAKLHPLAAAPGSAGAGQVYYNTADKLLYVYNGTAWAAVGAVVSVNSKTGAVTLTQDDVGDGSTYVRTHNDLTDTLKNTINNALPKSGGTMTGNIAMGSNSITGLATPSNDADAATKKYVDDAFAVNDAMIFKGTIGTGGTVTALPATHNAGWTYRVITAGTYAGKTCEVGDLIICVADGTAASNDDWTVAQTNIDGAVTGPGSSTSGHIPTFSGTTGKVLQDGYGVATSISNDSTSIPTTAAVNTAVTGLIKTATGTIGTSATTATVDFSGTLINAYATMGGAIVALDITPGASSVVFTTATGPASAVTCTVVYA